MFRFRLFVKSVILFSLLLLPAMLSAVETAPRISDREIIEGLAGLNLKYAEIKAEFKIVHERFKSIDQRMNAEFKRIDERFDSIDQRFESIDQRFESIDQRFVSLENRLTDSFSSLMNLILVLFGSLITLIVALFGYIAWDRKTSMRPIEKEVQVLKQDLEIQRKTTDGVSIADVLKILRETAHKNPPLADALRNASLM